MRIRGQLEAVEHREVDPGSEGLLQRLEVGDLDLDLFEWPSVVPAGDARVRAPR